MQIPVNDPSKVEFLNTVQQDGGQSVNMPNIVFKVFVHRTGERFEC